MKRASEIIDELFSQMNFESEKEYISLFQQWEQIAGTDAAEHTWIHEIEGSKLIISADHPAWANMLSMKKQTILKEIGSKFPELNISQIKIILGKRS